MSKQITYETYLPRDETAILELFNTSFGKKMNIDFWQWRFKDNPTGQMMVELAWDDEILVAHYAISPVILSVNGKDHFTALSMTTMTHPNYRGRRLFPILSTRLYERLRLCDYSIVWGFPNYRSHPTFINRLAWDDIYEIPMFTLNVEYLSELIKISRCIVELSIFDEKFDILWEKVKCDNEIWVKRDQKYLNWRYILNPTHKYTILAYIDNDELLGYAVYKKYYSDIDIVDFVSVQGAIIGEELINSIFNMALLQGDIKRINMWFNLHHPLHGYLERMCFQNNVPVTYLGSKKLDDSKHYSVDFKNYSNWYLQMGDSDVY